MILAFIFIIGIYFLKNDFLLLRTSGLTYQITNMHTHTGKDNL